MSTPAERLINDIFHKKDGNHPMLSKEEIEMCRIKAFKNAVTTTYQKYYMQELEDNEDFLSQDPKYDEFKSILKEMNDKKKSGESTHIFLTVNSRPGTTLQNFMKKIRKCANKKWCTDIAVVIEQRSEDIAHMGEGIHAHMLINRGTEAAKARKELKNTFKDICDVENPHCLNIQWRKGNGVEKALNYIKGIKKDEEKGKKMEIDKEWRKLNEIKEIYVTEDLKNSK